MSQHSNNNLQKFASRWGFIMASVGSAVGMANVWGFPARLGANGGGAFLLVYLFFIILFSSIALPAEYALGRRAKTGTLGAYELAWKKQSKCISNVGKCIGWIPLAGSLCIALGYAVILSYILKALYSTLFENLMTVDTGAWFESFALNSYSVIPFHIIVVALTISTLFLGAKSIEKTNKIMMPIFFVIFIILAIRTLFLPQALEGYKFIINPQWEHFKNPMIWVWAMGQALFSLSITGSGMIVYGKYLSDNEDVVGVARHTGLFDTIASIIAALVVIPACFAYGLDISGGPSLLFVTLPRILQDIQLGKIFAIILYLAMLFAGISSLQNMFEVVAESLLYKFPKLSRKNVLIILSLICLAVGINMEAIFHWGPWMDIVSIYIIPIGAAIGAMSWFFVMKKEDLMEEINKASNRLHGNTWYYFGKYLYVPCVIIICLIALFKGISF